MIEVIRALTEDYIKHYLSCPHGRTKEARQRFLETVNRCLDNIPTEEVRTIKENDKI